MRERLIFVSASIRVARRKEIEMLLRKKKLNQKSVLFK